MTLEPCEFRTEDHFAPGLHRCALPLTHEAARARGVDDAFCGTCSPEFRAVGRRLMAANPERRCRHLGAPTGESVACGTCPGATRIKTFSCAVLGRCSFGKQALPGVPFCGQDPVHGVGITCGAFSAAVEVPPPAPFPAEEA